MKKNANDAKNSTGYGLLKIFISKILVIICLLPTPSKVSAQDEESGRSPEESAQYQTEWMKSKLMLDSSVVPAVYDINLKYARKNQSILKSGAPKMQKYKELKASSSAKDQEMKKVLSPEQYETYLQKKEELKQKMRERYQERKKQ